MDKRTCKMLEQHLLDVPLLHFVAGKTYLEFQLKGKLKAYGVENFDDLLLVEDSNNPGMNRGYALLEFSTRPEAMDAFRRLQKRGVVFGVDRSAKVSFADSYPQVDDEIMAQVSSGSSFKWF
jgi:hypothetical protein